MTVDDVKLIELPKFTDPRGNLSFVEQNNHIPFEIKRTYWIYDVPGGENRGGHAFINTEEFIVALSGGFDITFGQNIRYIFRSNPFLFKNNISYLFIL